MFSRDISIQSPCHGGLKEEGINKIFCFEGHLLDTGRLLKEGGVYLNYNNRSSFQSL